MLVPYDQINTSGGGLQFGTSFIRARVLSFCDILACILIGVIAGKFISLWPNKKGADMEMLGGIRLFVPSCISRVSNFCNNVISKLYPIANLPKSYPIGNIDTSWNQEYICAKMQCLGFAAFSELLFG